MPALRRGLRLPAERDALRQDLLRLLDATLLIMPSPATGGAAGGGGAPPPYGGGGAP